MKIYNFEQRSPEWYAIRCGMPTSSNFDKIITSQGKPSKQNIKYLYKVAGEYITGVGEDTYQSAVMLRGCEMEAEAKSLYEIIKDVTIQEIGFVVGDPVFEYGCSPDGFIGETGLIEVKCPIISTHVGYLFNDKFPNDYFQQVQGQLLVTERQWCDFVSYYPGLKPFIVRVERDKEFIDLLKIELKIFCLNLKETISKIK